MPGNRRRYSVSAIQLFHDCPQAYRFRYIDRVKVDRATQGEPLRIGSAVHAGLEAAGMAIKFDGLSVGDQELYEVADKGLEEEWLDQKLPADDGRLDECKGWMRDAIDEWEHDGEIRAIEWRIETELPNGSGFLGFADRVDRLGDNVLEIRDFKNTRGMKTEDELLTDLQVNMYGFFGLAAYPWAESVVASHQYPNHDGKVVRVRLTDNSIGEAVAMFVATVEMIENEENWEVRVSDRCRWCDYKDICPAWIKNAEDDDADAAAIRDIIENF